MKNNYYRNEKYVLYRAASEEKTFLILSAFLFYALNTDYKTCIIDTMLDTSRIIKPTSHIRTKNCLRRHSPTEFNFPMKKVLNYRDETTHTHTHTHLPQEFRRTEVGVGDDEKCTLTKKPDFYSQSALVKNRVYIMLCIHVW
jgi:hypothetical protein